MDSSGEDEDKLEPTFRIRFTIGKEGGLSSSSRNIEHQNHGHCNHHPWSRLYETKQSNHQIIDDYIERSPDCHQSVGDNLNQVKLYRYIEPQNHKSALFVNLSDKNHNSEDQGDRHLFISPTLNDQPASPASSSNSTPCSSTSSYEILDVGEVQSELEIGREVQVEDDKPGASANNKNLDDDMSHGCNFINWMSASRRRASSVTPSGQMGANGTGQAPPPTGRNAASTDDLMIVVNNNQQTDSSPKQNRSSSSNRLGVSNETVCAIERNKRPPKTPATDFVHLNMPLEVEIDSPDPGLAHPVSIDDILQIDINTTRLEEECQELEAQARYWEEQVEELERQQFADDVPRTLVENIIKHRKDLRNLEFQLYLQELESDESISLVSSGFGDKLSQSPSEQLTSSSSPPSNNRTTMASSSTSTTTITSAMDNNHFMMDLRESSNYSPAGKFGSLIKPGQENTADILNAIPPSSSQQRRQYLTKSSRATDTSEYSQLPHFDLHKHQHPISGHHLHHHHLHHHHHHHHHQPHHQREQRSGTPKGSPVPMVAYEAKEYDSTMMDVQQQQHQMYQNNVHHSSRHHHVSRRHIQLQMSRNTANEKELMPEYINNRLKSSPVRPNHFKTEFNTSQLIVSQDDSSPTTTSSSSSPHQTRPGSKTPTTKENRQ